ncbi:LysM peptidoglycan-binding domain-containing protein [Microbulbifer thermotolerans]|uniref:LysM peptidoglycan-binding domain-containing protein n=1 Tax=Microbulbifer thermotolerans TaxID=252514 RepID=UPI00224B4141|nr:LysM peptidoglycan-binding domain-containing protein [Microbulbifer thermotolerans]MCX2833941.1 LysM peptidoglycan-binding domain-containing protein [Microbulbifer thermotolerans]WKT59201.1 LysM peptidoglycan-binding domain-containing protein [Microbulbifer thermotolerans]
MVHKKLTIAILAAAVGACAQIPEQNVTPEDSAQQAQQNTAQDSDNANAPSPEEAALPPVDIWDRLRRGFQLDRHIDHPKVKDYIAYFSRNEGYMARVTERSRRYIFHVVEQLEDSNLPLELALLPIVESAYDPFAYSHARASGMWQFIPSTGRSFGLNQNWWYDGRRDVQESTRAAIRYFTYLSERFDGDWELVLAAYNGGEGTVSRALERNRRRGLGTSFWDLKLPRETQRYVPQLLALAEVVSRPDHYQVPLHDVANAPYYTEVDVGSQIDLAQAAELADIPIEELYLLNPGFNRWATDPNGNHRLLVPVEKGEAFASALAKLPVDQRVTWQRYRIARGDTLSTIARRYETTVAAIREANNLRNNNIRAGSTLLIPSASGPASQYAYALDQRVKRSQNAGKGVKTSYTVRPGDTLWDIARSLNVSVRQLASWNNMAPADTLRPGRQLVAYSGSTDSSRTTRKLSYKVRKGDSLYRIASKFRIDIDDILRWNKISKSHYLQPGQRLTLFVDSAASG